MAVRYFVHVYEVIEETPLSDLAAEYWWIAMPVAILTSYMVIDTFYPGPMTAGQIVLNCLLFGVYYLFAVPALALAVVGGIGYGLYHLFV